MFECASLFEKLLDVRQTVLAIPVIIGKRDFIEASRQWSE
jgi:hypothetical protein